MQPSSHYCSAVLPTYNSISLVQNHYFLVNYSSTILINLLCLDHWDHNLTKLYNFLFKINCTFTLPCGPLYTYKVHITAVDNKNVRLTEKTRWIKYSKFIKRDIIKEKILWGIESLFHLLDLLFYYILLFLFSLVC